MFGRFFKRRQPTASQPATNTNWEEQLVWRAVGDPENPFSVEVLDCRPVALSFLSTTQDRTVAESFGRLRKTNGTELIGKLPEKAITVDCDLRFPYDGKHSDGPLLIAKQMEEK